MKNSGGPLSTLLLTAPLLVVPTLAALGLPGATGAREEGGLSLAGPDAGDLGGAPFADAGFGEEAPLADGFGDGGFAGDGFAGDGFGDDGFGDGPVETAFADAAEAPDDLFPADGGFENADAPADPPAAPRRWAGGREAPAVPAETLTVAAEAPADFTETSARTPVARTPVAVAAAPPADADLQALAGRLKDAGATRLTLEPLGSAEAGFYFACTLPPAATGSAAARRFEAEGDTPETAVADVLDQVRDHRAGLAGGRLPVGDVALAHPAR